MTMYYRSVGKKIQPIAEQLFDSHIQSLRKLRSTTPTTVTALPYDDVSTFSGVGPYSFALVLFVRVFDKKQVVGQGEHMQIKR